MIGEFFHKIRTHLHLLSFSIPIAILVVSAFFPLQPVIRQGMIGVILVWFGLESMHGFSFWH